MVEAVGPLARLLKGSGVALMAASGLMAVATLLHPSQETTATIIASEARTAVTAHPDGAFLMRAARAAAAPR